MFIFLGTQQEMDKLMKKYLDGECNVFECPVTPAHPETATPNMDTNTTSFSSPAENTVPPHKKSNLPKLLLECRVS